MKASGPREVEAGAVVAAVERRVAEGRAEERVEQALHGAAAAAVGELDRVSSPATGTGQARAKPSSFIVRYSAATAAGTPR